MTCRICLAEVETSNSVNIFRQARKEELISDLIMNFAFIEVFENDDLPKVICPTCLKHIHDIYDFKDLIIKSDAHLRDMHETSSASDKDELNNGVYNEEESLDDNNLKFHQPIVQIECEGTPVNFVACKNSDYKHSPQTESEQSEDLQAHFLPYENKIDDEAKKGKMYKCNQCQNSFKNRYNLLLHKTTHTGIFPHNCDICNKGFATNWAMTVHRRIHFEERPFKCELCDKSFKSKSAQIIHRKIHLGIKRYQCKICGKQFVQMGGLKAHQFTHTNEKPIVCEFCGKHYTSKRALDRHSRIHRDEPNHPCPICGKFYAGAMNVKIHIKTVHAEHRIRFPCEVCDKSFSSKSVRKVHMRIHEGVKPYSCDICGKSFRQGSVATLHKRVHTGETPFHCTWCDKKFAYKHHLKKHSEKDHSRKEIDLQ